MTMTLQESFNHICRNIIAASAPSVAGISDKEKTCQYRGDNGAKCVVGWLIPDQYYYPWMEGSGVMGLLEKYPELRQEVPFIQPWRSSDLEILQKMHDAAALKWQEGMDWGSIIRAELAKFAASLDLKMDV